MARPDGERLGASVGRLAAMTVRDATGRVMATQGDNCRRGMDYRLV